MPEEYRLFSKEPVEAAPLAVFRILFGILMLWSILRFWSYGWIEKLYLTPKFHFSFYGFEWIKPLGIWTYCLFGICGLTAVCIALGYKYRLAIILFFLSFSYIELMDKTTYLNHYYFISILSFLMIFLPANAYFSLDALRYGEIRKQFIPKWTLDALKLLLILVYVYAGLAKLNSDWLLEAMPLKIWLPAKYDAPLIGGLMQQAWVPHIFSWFGALYDLAIPFLLLYRPTRWMAFVAVVVFHLMTRALFNIGMFPYIMIAATLIFFDAGFHKKIIRGIAKLLGVQMAIFNNGTAYAEKHTLPFRVKYGVITLFFVIQLLMPWRYLAYPGELFWTEEGYRFSWRVMLMEKSGYAQFKIVDKVSGKWFYVDNTDFLSSFQEKQMSFQPDFVLEYAHYLKQHFESQGHQNIAVYVESYVTLNGRLSRPYIDPTVDLTQETESFEHKKWILPFEDEIKGI